MKKLALFAAIVISGAVCLGQAQAQKEMQKKEKLASELMAAMQVKKQMSKSIDLVKKMQIDMLKSMTQDINNQQLAMKVQSKVFDIVEKEMSWDNFKQDVIKIYAEVYSEKELKDLVDFFKSPAGQSYIEKAPELQRRMMPIMQQKIMQIMPKVKAATKELIETEVKKQKKAKPEAKATTPCGKSVSCCKKAAPATCAKKKTCCGKDK
jgi:hypothetical protein